MSNNFFKQELKYYLLALTPVTVIFFLIPFELYFNGKEYWNWDYNIAVSFAKYGILIYLLFLILIGLCSRLNHQLPIYISTGLFLLGLYLLLADVFSPLQTTPLDGTKLVSSEPLVYTIIEAVIFFSMIAIFMKLDFNRFSAIAVSISIGLILISIIYFGLILTSSKPAIAMSDQKSTKNIQGNIYHFVLDEMQTDAALLYLQEEKQEHFPGFTVFKNNISNYPFTAASLPSYFSGTVYDGGDGSYTKWDKKYKKEGLLNDLRDNAYNVMMYPDNSKWCVPQASVCTDLNDIYGELTGISDSFYGDFIQIWFARILPNFLTNEALFVGKQLGDFIFNKYIKKDRTKIPVTDAEGKNQYSSVLMLRYLTDTEKDRPPKGQYIYAHAILPHGGFVINDNCQYDFNLRSTGTDGYYKQVACSLNLIAEFIKELKSLGRYDDATIIIHGDTGHGGRGFIKKAGSKIMGTADNKRKKVPFLNKKYNSKKWTEEQWIARVMSLLMIKPAHSLGNLTVSERLSQLIDLYPTLVDILKLNSSNRTKMQGLSLFSGNFPENRQISFFLFNPGGKDIVKLIVSDPKRISDSDLIVDSYFDRN